MWLGVLVKLLSREVDLRALASINDDNERTEDGDDDDTLNSAICLKTTTTPEGAMTTDDANIPGFVSPASQVIAILWFCLEVI